MLYFAYGANLSLAHMRLWCPGGRPIARAALPNHRLVFRFWCDLLRSAGEQVQGALYDVPYGDMRSLDESEDCPDLYEPRGVQVRTSAGATEALAYQMRPGLGFAPPSEAYLALVRQGYDDWGLDRALLPLPATEGAAR